MRPRIGGHVSVAGGLHNGIANALSIGADCAQFFGSSPRQWKVRKPSAQEAERYLRARGEAGISPVYLHASYLVNLASPNTELYKKSVENLASHLEIAEEVKADGLIFHTGVGEAEGVVRGVNEVLSRVPGKVPLLLENSATPKKLGAGLRELGEMLERISSDRVLVCLDTAHACAAGQLEFTPSGVALWADEIERGIGLGRVPILHVNDSKAPCGSFRDLHENIGEGVIGKRGFSALAKEKRFGDKAWILEVPGFSGDGPDVKNIRVLRSLFA